MRVSAATKVATRERILQAALRLFAAQGFEATTTRDIAQAAEIATGTLFNYFPTKDAVVACLAGEAAADALARFANRTSKANRGYASGYSALGDSPRSHGDTEESGAK